MIYAAVGLASVGLLLSAFFSGSETGFYRATRLRLVLDALGGDRIARALVWLGNRPMLFVATILVGNNLANYLTSLAVVIAVSFSPMISNAVLSLIGLTLAHPDNKPRAVTHIRTHPSTHFIILSPLMPSPQDDRHEQEYTLQQCLTSHASE